MATDKTTNQDAVKDTEALDEAASITAEGKKDADSDEAEEKAEDEDEAEDEAEDTNESLELQLDESVFDRIVPIFESQSLEVSTKAVESLFEGEELSDDFKTKASVIFDNVLNERIAEAIESIEEQAQAVLAERIESIEESMLDLVDSYLTNVVTEWAEENALVIEQGIITEKRDSFLGELQTLLEDYNIFMAEDTANAIDSAKAELAESVELVEAAKEQIALLEKELFEVQAEKEFVALSEGLTETQVDRFRTLMESFEFETVEQFSEKAKLVKEAFTTKLSKTDSAKQTITESKETITEGTSKDQMSKYLSAAKRMKNDR